MIQNERPRSLQENPAPSDWVSFKTGGKVLLGTGKVELGQGILTSLCQLAADELGVDISSIETVSGVTGESPEELFTSGSQSIEVSGSSIRYVCAAVRERLVSAVSALTGKEKDELQVVDGRVFHDGSPTDHSYWTMTQHLRLAERLADLPMLRGHGGHRFVGTSIARHDLPEKVFGGGFIHDVRLPGMLYANVLRGPVRNALLLDFDEARAGRILNVEIFRRGGFVAFLSPEERLSRAALLAARATANWDLPSIDPGMANPHGFLQDETIDRVVQREWKEDVEGTRFSATFSRPFLAHASIGPSCALAEWDGKVLTVLTHSQGVGPLRKAISGVLDLDPRQVRVAHRHGAGAYGQNGADDVALDAAVIAVSRVNTPIRVQWTREDELSVSPFGSAMAVRVEATLDAEWVPRNWQMDIWSCSHGRRPGMGGTSNLAAASEIRSERERTIPFDVPDPAGGGGLRNALAPYDFEQTISYHLLVRQPLHTSSIRALGAQVNVFSIESCMDEFALVADMDPLDYRLRFLSEPRLRGVLEAVADMSGWKQRGSGGEGRGLGLGVSRYKNKSGYAAVVAEVDVSENISLRRLWCAADCGLVVNPDGAINQIEGGMVQAASWSLKEQVTFDETGVTSSSWDTYPILRFSEVPEIEVRLVNTDQDLPLGAGEIVTGPTTAAIGNAIAHALGVRIRDLPFTRDRIVSAIMGEG